MANRLLIPLTLLDEAVHPFHRMMAAVTFVGTLSLQAVVTAYLEPVKMIWFSFVLTFPLTTGLTIVFLVLYHFNWKTARFSDLFVGAGLFALLFLVLNGLYSVLGLEKVAKKYEADEKREQMVQHYKDSLEDPGKFQRLFIEQQRTIDSTWKARHSWNAGSRTSDYTANLKKFADDNRDFTTARPQSSSQNFLTRFAIPFVFLWRQLEDFYLHYGAIRFWSGVVLALCFSIYLTSMKKKWKSESVE
jgi:hypothetical protein